MKRILLLEDDLSLGDGLSYSIKKQGFEIDLVRTVAEAYRCLDNYLYDLLLLDVSLPDGSGFDVCRKVRQLSTVPIIFLTASDEEVSIVMGLDIGGDDYIVKPFKLGILISRINALLRRADKFGSSDSEITLNGIKVSILQGQAYKEGSLLNLTTLEFKLLSMFIQNPGIVLTKERIQEKLWDYEENFVDDNTLAVYIHRLRSKIEDNPSKPARLLTIRGLGYKWSA